MSRKAPVKGIKLPAGVSQEFYDSIQSKTVTELSALVVQLQVNMEEAEAIKATEGYQEAKAAFDMVAGPLRETRTALKNRTKLVLERMKEKGGA